MRTTAPLNVALVGYGYVGKVFHAPLVTHTDGLHLHTVVSGDAGKVHADFPDVRVLGDTSAAFGDDAIDLVVIAAPNDVHAPLAIAALDAGKHVVVDKPFTTTLQEARQVVDAAERNNRIASVFQNRRWDSDFLTLRGLIDSGELGEVVELHSHFDRFRPQVPDRWRERAGAGTGLWFDLGPHLVDQALQLFGTPLAVQADIAIQRQGAVVDDYFHVVLRYARLRVVLHAGALVAARNPRFSAHGTRGSFTKHGLDTQESMLKAGIAPGSTGWGHDPLSGTLTVVEADVPRETPVEPVPGDYREFYMAMRDAILGNAEPPVTTRQAIEVMRLLELGAASARERRTLAFD